MIHGIFEELPRYHKIDPYGQWVLFCLFQWSILGILEDGNSSNELVMNPIAYRLMFGVFLCDAGRCLDQFLSGIKGLFKTRLLRDSGRFRHSSMTFYSFLLTQHSQRWSILPQKICQNAGCCIKGQALYSYFWFEENGPKIFLEAHGWDFTRQHPPANPWVLSKTVSRYFPNKKHPNHPMFNRGFHYFHHPFWGTIIFGNTQIDPDNSSYQTLKKLVSLEGATQHLDK